jgi:transposase
MSIVTVGIDLAKNVFAVHGVNAEGKDVLVRPRVARAKLLQLIASIPPCTIGMEACSGANYWARQFQQLGHTVKIMAAKFVAPHRMGGKNDAADAAAICTALVMPKTRFVPIKDIDQQAILCLHRVRNGFVEERTALVNRIRGLLQEFGVVLPLKTATIRREAAACLEDLPGWAGLSIGDCLNEMARLDERILQYDAHLRKIAKDDPRTKQLQQLLGVGDTTASAILATVGNGYDFKSSRQFSAWLGLVPKQRSSGGKARLGRITKAGDSYLRTLLTLGARSVLNRAAINKDPISVWALQLQTRRGYGKAVVAIAAKNARMLWAILRKGEDFVMPTTAPQQAPPQTTSK